MKKKTWNRSKVVSIDVGICRYCGETVNNQESFVCFADKSTAHYQCMKKDDLESSEKLYN